MSCIKQQLLHWKKNCQLCLDVRPSQEYLKRHIAPSTNIPFKELAYRLGELPPKPIPFALVTSTSSNFNDAYDFLKARGWQPQYIFDTTAMVGFWDKVQQLGYLSTGARYPPWLLFRPHGLFLDHMPLIQSRLSSSQQQQQQKNKNKKENDRINILDIGCGSGRDLTYVLLNNPTWHGIGVDYLPGAYQRFQSMTQSVQDRIQFVYAKLLMDGTWKTKEKGGDGDNNNNDNETIIPTNTAFDMIITIRFFNRPLLRLLPTLFLKPGGLMVISHFIDHQDQRQQPYYFPKKEKRLYPGELNQFARDLNLTILVD
ncbi:hypothetical protein BJ944DRAFT_272860, partial [Cunninghamella echinulata]